MIKTKLNIEVIEEEWLKHLPEIEKLSEEVFAGVINSLKPDWLIDKQEVIINLALSNDNDIRQLNFEFRKIDKPTNVLSFANIDDEEFEAYLKRNQEIELGDIIIAFQTMLEQSNDQELSLYDHYCHILIHGILHLLGYDHIEEEERLEMENQEIKILETFNIKNPYEENR